VTPRSTSEPTRTQSELRAPDIEEQIRRRAYELHEERGNQHGHDVDDWLQAESELIGKARSAA